MTPIETFSIFLNLSVIGFLTAVLYLTDRNEQALKSLEEKLKGRKR